jgi:UDP-glucose 4-epimerase
VTGGAGFVGGHVVAALLEDGARVRVVDDFSSGSVTALHQAFELGLVPADVRRADVTLPAGQREIDRWAPDVVLHLAANARVGESIRDPYTDARINVLGTVSVLAAAARAGAAKVVLASSGGTIYGSLPDGESRLGEEARRGPLSPYGLSKLTAHSYTELYQRLFGLPCTVLALGNVYGPGQLARAGVAAATVQALAGGRRPRINGTGLQTRDFVYVSDVAAAFVRAVRAAPAGTVNIGTGVETSIIGLVERVRAAFGSPLRPEYYEASPGEVERICLDPRRAEERLGWRPAVDLGEGIERMVARHRQHV